MKKNWRQFTDYDWLRTAKDVTSYDEVAPSPLVRERAANRQNCMKLTSSERVTMQDGVSDKFEYRRCPLEPYADGGVRMKNRPELQN